MPTLRARAKSCASSTPSEGDRKLAFDPKTGLVSSLTYDRLPTPYKVQRTGYSEKKVALTFDDGPDEIWTPQILSILEQYKVPATFLSLVRMGCPSAPCCNVWWPREWRSGTIPIPTPTWPIHRKPASGWN
jgi:hypothetical protein